MNTERIKEIQQETAYPESISVQQALLKVWNECEQEKVVNKNDLLPDVSWRRELLKAFVEWQIQGNTPYAGMLIDEHIRSYFKSL